MTAKIYKRKCVECKAEFQVSGPAAGRRKTCSEACQKLRQRAAEKRYAQRKAEEYDPWQWENTVLAWNE